MKTEKTEYTVEVKGPSGWHRADGPFKTSRDAIASKANVLEVLRNSGMTRYTLVRILKTTATTETLGREEAIHV